MSQDTHEDIPEVPLVRADGPGQLLREAREAAGLDTMRVASELHLAPETIEALEQDHYDALPPAIFVRGYLRAYGELLGLPVDELLEAHARLQPQEQQPLLRNEPVERTLGQARLSLRLILLVLFLLAVVGGVAWWLGAGPGSAAVRAGRDSGAAPATRGSHSAPASGSGGKQASGAKTMVEKLAAPAPAKPKPKPKPTSSSGSGASQPATGQGPATSGKTGVAGGAGSSAAAGGKSKPGAADKAGGDGQSASSAAAGPTMAAAVSAPAGQIPERAGMALAKQTLEGSSSGAPEPAATGSGPRQPAAAAGGGRDSAPPAPADSGQPQGTAVSGQAPSAGAIPPGRRVQLHLSFQQDCWVEVQDARQKRLLYALVPAGQQRTLVGEAPVHVFLGNAPGVQVQVDGKVYPTARYTRSNHTARFVLKPR